MNALFPKDFWEILSRFPHIKNLSDLTGILVDIKVNEIDILYPTAYTLLREFEASMRSHIYTEWHAQEFYDDAEIPDLT